MMILTITRNNGDEEAQKRKKKKSTVFLLFCVSVGSFCDELTVVFCSFVCSFSTNSYAFKGGRGGGCWVLFPFPRLSGTAVGRAEKKPSLHRKKERKKDLHDGKRR